jgi:hypothetical protein
MTGKAMLAKPLRCNWCGKKSMNLVKIHSHEDKSTLRICEEHYLRMPIKPREWDLWVAVAFPKWDKKVHHRDREAFLVEAKHFIKLEQTINKELNNGSTDKGTLGEERISHHDSVA